MNRRISSILFTILGASIFATAPALADVFGVAEQGDISSNPSSTEMSDALLGNFGGIYSPGYLIVATTSPSCFAGMTWHQIGKNLTSGQAGIAAPAFCSVSFEVTTGSLSISSPQNPNLTIVVQDATGDYFYAGKNQGVVPTYIATQAGYDLFTLVAPNSSFGPATGGGGTIPMARLEKIAAVWSGWNDTLPPINQMYMTRTLINSQAVVSGPFRNHAPATYNTTTQPVFNFQ